MTLDEFFSGYEGSRPLFDVLLEEVERLGPVRMRVSKSQVAFGRDGDAKARDFAWAWTPGRYLRRGDVPLVLSLAFVERVPSPRWKQVVEPAPGRFMHHLELRSAGEIDDEVRAWLRRAWDEAGG